MTQENIQSNVILEANKSADDSRVIKYILTKEQVDSMGRIIKVSGMDLSWFKKFRSVYYNHNTYDLPIGKMNSIRKNGDEIVADIEFATWEESSFADTIYQLVRGKYINGGSIGVRAEMKDIEVPEKPMKVGGKEVKLIINKSQLKEFSITPTPANDAAVPLNASLDKAMKDGIINEDQVNEFQSICAKDESEDLKSDGEDDKNSEQTIKGEDIITLKARVAELELQLKEQEIEEEIQDSVYDDLYAEFVGSSQDEEEDDDTDILDEYFEEMED